MRRVLSEPVLRGQSDLFPQEQPGEGADDQIAPSALQVQALPAVQLNSQPETEEEEEDVEPGYVSRKFLRDLEQERREFTQNLSQADHQLMLDDRFINILAGMATKKIDEFYVYDSRDTEILSMVDAY